MVKIYQFKKDAIKLLDMQELVRHVQDDKAEGVIWVDMEDPSDAEDETMLISLFDIHPLAIEDCRRGKELQRHLPKVEDFSRYLFIIFNPLQEIPGKGRETHVDLKTSQLSAFMFKQALITHHYGEISAIREAVQHCSKNPHALGRGPDYIYHLIIDAIVDGYNPILDRLDIAVGSIEDEVLRKPTQRCMARILRLKKDIMTIRRIAVYQREMLSRLSRGEFSLITREEMVFYRNVYDHLLRMSDLADSYRDMVAGVLDAYLSATSNRLNEIIKVLTIISTIFLPLNFITGYFGMNFEELPLIGSTPGPWVVTALMIAVVVGMLWFFKKRQWF